MSLNPTALTGACALALIGLSACDNGPSAVRTRDRGEAATVASYAASEPTEDRTYISRTRARSRGRAATAAGGWAASRQHTGAENAAFHFERDGADFGARDVGDYVTRARTFVSRPPKGTLTLERKNGDTLFYDPKANTFAVASKDGAPRTMFKPKDGAAYWDEQKARERRSQARARDDDERG
jgi:pyocin large subunit-like protein